jgi:hypothetical protein
MGYIALPANETESGRKQGLLDIWENARPVLTDHFVFGKLFSPLSLAPIKEEKCEKIFCGFFWC